MITVAGEALVDLALLAPPALEAHPGGGPFNTARTLGRLDVPVAFLGRVSTDRFGRLLEEGLRADGVDLRAVVTTADPTTLALAELDEAGAARYRFYFTGTSASGLTPDVALARLPEPVTALHAGTLGLVIEPLATAVAALIEHVAGRALVVVDLNCRPDAFPDRAAYRTHLDGLLPSIDVVKASEDDLAWLEPDRPAEETARALLRRGPRALLLTRGGEGAAVVTGESAVPVPPVRVRVVDTIGAGDAFGGAFLAWWHEHRLGREELADVARLERAARFAAHVAAKTCERAGASPPRRAEIDPTVLAG
jgi:fructokinase